MNNLLACISIVSGIYSIIISFALNTKNFASALVFKILPFFFGAGCIFVGLTLLNIISINL